MTARRQPVGAAEEAAAREIAEELGDHPLALEVAGAHLAKGLRTFQQYRAELAHPDHDAAEFGAELKEFLPTGHERSISSTLLKSIVLVGEDGLEFLRIASLLAIAAIPVSLVEQVFAAAQFENSDVRTLRALDQVDSQSV